MKGLGRLERTWKDLKQFERTRKNLKEMKEVQDLEKCDRIQTVRQTVGVTDKVTTREACTSKNHYRTIHKPTHTYTALCK